MRLAEGCLLGRTQHRAYRQKFFGRFDNTPPVGLFHTAPVVRSLEAEESKTLAVARVPLNVGNTQ